MSWEYKAERVQFLMTHEDEFAVYGAALVLNEMICSAGMRVRIGDIPTDHYKQNLGLIKNCIKRGVKLLARTGVIAILDTRPPACRSAVDKDVLHLAIEYIACRFRMFQGAFAFFSEILGPPPYPRCIPAPPCPCHDAELPHAGHAGTGR